MANRRLGPSIGRSVRGCSTERAPGFTAFQAIHRR